MNATDLYRSMVRSIYASSATRTTTDASSPTQEEMREAEFATLYRMRFTEYNVPTCIAVNTQWCIANTLHFFACTERAEPLYRYNRHASRFIRDGRWIGAYGAIALPQLHRCIELLRSSPQSRRAIVSMGELGEMDINRPACWTSLHFMRQQGALHTFVYQRSLGMRVMPYDCVLLTNIHRFMCDATEQPYGALHWCVGNLHGSVKLSFCTTDSILIPYELLRDSSRCWKELEDGLPSFPERTCSVVGADVPAANI